MKLKILAFAIVFTLITSFIIMVTPAQAEVGEQPNTLFIEGPDDIIFENIRYVHDGDIIIKDGTLRILNATLQILQDYTCQFKIKVSGDGQIIMENATLLSLATEAGASPPTLNIRLTEMATLVMTDSTIGCGINVELDNDATAEPHVLTDSRIHGALTLWGHSTAELTNSPATSIRAYKNAVAYLYGWLTVMVKDCAGVPVVNADVTIDYYLNLNAALVKEYDHIKDDESFATTTTGRAGSVTIAVLSDIISKDTALGSIFVGNYKVQAKYNGYTPSSEPVSLRHYETHSVAEVSNVVNEASVELVFSRVLIPPSTAPEGYYSNGNASFLRLQGAQNMTIESGSWKESKNIEIRGTSVMTIRNTDFELLQERTKRHYMLVKEHGKLIIEGSTLHSNYPLNLYLYDNATLIAKDSVLNVNTIGARDNSTIELNGCNITGNLNLIVDDNEIVISNTVVTSSDIYLQSPSHKYTDVTFNQPLIFDGNSMATLTNVKAPRIEVKENAKVWVYWWLTIKTLDLDRRPVTGCEVELLYYDYDTIPPTEIHSESKYTNGGDEGTVKFKVLSRLITAQYNTFFGNYKAIATYQNDERYITEPAITAVDDNTYLELLFDVLIAWPRDITVDAAMKKALVPSGAKTIVTGSASLEEIMAAPSCSVTITIVETGDMWTTTTDKTGLFRQEIQAPYRMGEYTLNIYITTDHISGEQNISLIVDGAAVGEQDVLARFTEGYLPWSILGMVLTWLILYIGMKKKIAKEYKETEQK